MLEIAHHIPGRIRLRVRDNAVAVGLMARLEALAGIRRILRRRYSIIVEYDPMRLPADALTAACALPAGTTLMEPANARPGAALSGAFADAVLQHLVERLLFSLVAALLQGSRRPDAPAHPRGGSRRRIPAFSVPQQTHFCYKFIRYCLHRS